MIGRHVEGPHELLDLEPRRVGRRDEARDAASVAGLARGAGEDVVVGGVMEPGVPVLLAGDHPLVAVADRRRLHPGGVGAVQRLGESESDARRPGEHLRDPLGLLCRRAVLLHHQHGDEVADDRALVLQVVVQAESLACEMLAHDRHLEVAGVVAAETFRAAGGGRTRPRRRRPASVAAALPTRRWAARRGPSRFVSPRVDGRRSGCCRPPASIGLIVDSMNSSRRSRNCWVDAGMAKSMRRP